MAPLMVPCQVNLSQTGSGTLSGDHHRRPNPFDDLPHDNRNADGKREQRDVPSAGAREATGSNQADNAEADCQPAEPQRENKADDLNPAEWYRDDAEDDA